MGSRHDTAGGRSLRLTRETLRDLAPSPADAAAVRGGDTSTCGKRELCLHPDRMLSLLGQTSMSWGCTGTVRMMPQDEGFEIIFDLHPNQELLDAQARNLGDG